MSADARRTCLWALAVAGVLISLSSTARAQRVGFDLDRVYRIPIAGAPASGPADAPVTIVEFSDFRCPACRRAFSIVSMVQGLYPGKIRLVYHHLLLDPEDGNEPAQASAAAQAQGMFWPFHDRLFASTGRLDRASLERYAEEIGLDMVRFRDDLDRQAHLKSVLADDRMSTDIGMSSTPMFFVNGRPVPGAQPLGVFIRIIEEELTRVEKLLAAGVKPTELYDHITKDGLARGRIMPGGTPDPERPALDPGTVQAVEQGYPSHRRGADEPLVTLIEFSDFDCGYCRRTRPVLAQLHADLGDRVQIGFRHYVLGSEGGSKLVAEAAVYAGTEGKFWEFHDAAYERGPNLSRADLDRIAADLGLDKKRFARTLDRRTHLRDVLRDTARGRTLGVGGTPTFFINGLPLVGAWPYPALRTVIDAHIDHAELLLEAGVARAEVSRVAATPDARYREDLVPHISALLACQAGRADLAAGHAATVKSSAMKSRTRSGCAARGVKLPKK